MQRKKRGPKMGVERIARTTHPRSAQTYRRLCYFSAVAGGSPCMAMAARCMDVIRGLSQILRYPTRRETVMRCWECDLAGGVVAGATMQVRLGYLTLYLEAEMHCVLQGLPA